MSRYHLEGEIHIINNPLLPRPSENHRSVTSSLSNSFFPCIMNEKTKGVLLWQKGKRLSVSGNVLPVDVA